MPEGDTFVRDVGRGVKHDDGAVCHSVKVLAAASIKLSGDDPNIESNRSSVGVEDDGLDHHIKVADDDLLFELVSREFLDKSAFADTAISDEEELELPRVILVELNKC